jgi:hypothetical protein
MAKSTTSSAGTAPKRRTKKQPKASTLYGYLKGYINSNDIGEDQSIGVVMQQLRDSIVDESQDE